MASNAERLSQGLSQGYSFVAAIRACGFNGSRESNQNKNISVSLPLSSTALVPPRSVSPRRQRHEEKRPYNLWDRNPVILLHLTMGPCSSYSTTCFRKLSTDPFPPLSSRPTPSCPILRSVTSLDVRSNWYAGIEVI